MQGLPLFAARRRNFVIYLLAVAVPLVFLLTMLSQNVFAQNTFVITDGDQVIVHTTHASDPAMALDEAGVDVDPDEYYTTQSEDGVYDITVTRDDAVNVVFGGEELKFLIQDDTIGALLERNGIPIGEGYLLSCPATQLCVSFFRSYQSTTYIQSDNTLSHQTTPQPISVERRFVGTVQDNVCVPRLPPLSVGGC